MIGPITAILGDIVCMEGLISPLVSELGDDICGNQGHLVALPFLSLQGISIACDVHKHFDPKGHTDSPEPQRSFPTLIPRRRRS